MELWLWKAVEFWVLSMLFTFAWEVKIVCRHGTYGTVAMHSSTVGAVLFWFVVALPSRIWPSCFIFLSFLYVLQMEQRRLGLCCFVFADSTRWYKCIYQPPDTSYWHWVTLSYFGGVLLLLLVHLLVLVCFIWWSYKQKLCDYKFWKEWVWAAAVVPTPRPQSCGDNCTRRKDSCQLQTLQ